MIHIKTPKKRGARISGLVMHMQLAQLICTFRIPQLEFTFCHTQYWATFVQFQFFECNR